MSDPAAQLADLVAEVNTCTRCPLHQGRTNAVPGEGPVDADIMFIGEGPGSNEDKQGRPFVGASGKLLTHMLGTIGLQREDVYIANVVKCRPPSNRDPKPEEIAACEAYLYRQIDLIDPKVIVTLGRFSMARYFPDARISRIHGQAKQVDTRLIVPFFHPAAALHQPSLRATVEEDFKKLPNYIRLVEEGRLAKPPSPPPDASSHEGEDDDDYEQLSLF